MGNKRGGSITKRYDCFAKGVLRTFKKKKSTGDRGNNMLADSEKCNINMVIVRVDFPFTNINRDCISTEELEFDVCLVEMFFITICRKTNKGRSFTGTYPGECS